MQPILLNVDWLAVSVRFHEDDFGDLAASHFFVEADGTKVWRKRRMIFNEYAEKVATVLYEPKSKLIAENAALIEIANEWLYHGTHPYTILDMLRTWRLFDITGVSRVDFCADFNPTSRQWHHIQCLADGRDYVAGKQNKVPWYGLVKCPLLAERYQGQQIPYTITWGHKTTAVRWKLYYKSKELADAYGGKLMAKPYILDCWDEAKLDRKDVWRLEVSIHDANQLEFRGAPMTLEDVRKHPQEIFKSLYSRRFIVRRKENHKDKTNDREINFLPIGDAAYLKTAKAKNTTRRNPAITLVRHLLDALVQEEILLNDDLREQTLANIESVLELANLHNYFRAIVGIDFYSFVEDCRIRADVMRNGSTLEIGRSMSDIMRDAAGAKW